MRDSAGTASSGSAATTSCQYLQFHYWECQDHQAPPAQPTSTCAPVAALTAFVTASMPMPTRQTAALSLQRDASAPATTVGWLLPDTCRSTQGRAVSRRPRPWSIRHCQKVQSACLLCYTSCAAVLHTHAAACFDVTEQTGPACAWPAWHATPAASQCATWCPAQMACYAMYLSVNARCMPTIV